MNVLITGCNRGIGFGLAKQFLERTNAIVIATSRNPEAAATLRDLAKHYQGRLLTPLLDVCSDVDYDALISSLKSQNVHTIDILIGNAGIGGESFPQDSILSCNPASVMEVIETNVVGNLKLLQRFYPMLSASTLKLAALMSSSHGSYRRNVVVVVPRPHQSTVTLYEFAFL